MSYWLGIRSDMPDLPGQRLGQADVGVAADGQLAAPAAVPVAQDPAGHAGGGEREREAVAVGLGPGLPALIQCLSCRSVRWPLSRAMRTPVVRMWAGSQLPAQLPGQLPDWSGTR